MKAETLNNLEVIIMRRVRLIFLFRRFFASFGLRPLILVALFGAMWVKVSIVHVVQNAIAVGEPVSLYYFGTAAFAEAELVVKALALGLSFILLWLVVDLSRNISFHYRFRLPRFTPFRFR